VVNVRADGIAVVLVPLLSDARITAAALVDVDSGMVLDAWSAAPADDRTTAPAGPPDLELIGAQHAEVVRCALALLRAWPSAAGPDADTCEVVLGADRGHHHLLRTVPDPHGDRLALAVVVDGPSRVLDRVRKRLRSVAVDALTAGPSMTRRPVLGAWSFAMPGPDVPASVDLFAPGSPERADGAPTDDVLRNDLPVDDLQGVDVAPADSSSRSSAAPQAAAMNPAPLHPAPPHAAPLHPALSRLDAGRIALPALRDGRPSSLAAPPAPPVAAPPRSAPPAQADATTVQPRPHLRPIRSQPPDGAARTPSADDDADTRRPPAETRRPPSPPAALPAPAPPRQRRP